MFNGSVGKSDRFQKSFLTANAIIIVVINTYLIDFYCT